MSTLALVCLESRLFKSVIVRFFTYFTFIPDGWEVCQSVHYATSVSESMGFLNRLLWDSLHTSISYKKTEKFASLCTMELLCLRVWAFDVCYCELLFHTSLSTRWLRSLQVCQLWNFCVWEYGFFMSVIVSFGFVSHFTFYQMIEKFASLSIMELLCLRVWAFYVCYCELWFCFTLHFLPDDCGVCKSVHYGTFCV